MSGPAYRDDEPGLVEKRSLLIEERRAADAKRAVVHRVAAQRMARIVAGAVALGSALVLMVLDLAVPLSAASPEGNTALGEALLVAPLVALAAALFFAARRRRIAPFVETTDVRADVERLRAESSTVASDGATRLETASFVVPLLALAAWPAPGALHAFVELGGARAIRTFEMMPGGALRPMGTDEAFQNMLTGISLCALLAFAGMALGVWRSAGRGFPDGRDNAGLAGRFVGAVLLGATLAQLASSSVHDELSGVVLGYAAIGVGLAAGLGGAYATLASAKNLRERERAALDAATPQTT